MPTISKIEKQKNKLQRVNIFLDEEFFCAMQEYTLVKHGLKVGLEISKERLQELILESDKERAMNQVARLLQNGLKTENQIATYLQKKGYDAFITKYVLDKLKEYHYVDDAYYAKTYVKSTAKKYGKRKMKFMLKQKGLAGEEIEKALANFESDPEQIYVLAKKNLKNKPVTQENLQKVANHLAYKGFNWAEIKPIIERLKKE